MSKHKFASSFRHISSVEQCTSIENERYGDAIYNSTFSIKTGLQNIILSFINAFYRGKIKFLNYKKKVTHIVF